MASHFSFPSATRRPFSKVMKIKLNSFVLQLSAGFRLKGFLKLIVVDNFPLVKSWGEKGMRFFSDRIKQSDSGHVAVGDIFFLAAMLCSSLPTRLLITIEAPIMSFINVCVFPD